jgi:diguanylate cyclase (GGDEF)-like protein
MLSLKIKLVAYFLVLALLPIAAGYWGFASSLAAHERQRADERLSAELRAAGAAYHEKLAAARDRAESLASKPALQRALQRRDGRAIARLLRGARDIVVRSGGRTYGSANGTPAAHIRVDGPSGTVGEIVALLDVDDATLGALATRAGLAATDRLLVTGRGVVLAGAFAGRRLDAPIGRSTTTLGGTAYRVAAAAPSLGSQGVSLAIVTPQSPIDDATAGARRQLLLGVLGSLLLIGLVAYGEGAAIVRTIRRFVAAAQSISRGRLDERVPVRTRDEFGQLGQAFNDMADELEQQRRRLHRATIRFGEALAATHDIDQLLRVIVTTAVESTRAAGGVIRGESDDLARAGTMPPGAEEIAVPLAVAGESFGTLVLAGEAFEADDHEVIASLAAHAVTALENARLHQIVKRQALLDGLTNMPNRRQCESALATELSQAKRFGSPVAFVLADLDEFKSVNDRYGHLAGDRVLREFSDILRESVRESDVAARWGGEEFALVLPNTDAAGAAVLVERIRSTLEHRTIVAEGHAIAITASFGVAIFPDEQTATRLIGTADEALYLAKRRGKNRVETSPSFPLAAS